MYISQVLYDDPLPRAHILAVPSKFIRRTLSEKLRRVVQREIDRCLKTSSNAVRELRFACAGYSTTTVHTGASALSSELLEAHEFDDRRSRTFGQDVDDTQTSGNSGIYSTLGYPA